MTAILLSFLQSPTMLAIGAGVIAAAAAWMKGRLSGAKAERNKQLAGKLAVAEDRLEMDREATSAEREAVGMTDDAARKEAEKWARD